MQHGDQQLRVGEWVIEPTLLRIRHRDGDGAASDRVQRLEPKAMTLLLFLAERAPDVVSREELFQHVWDGRAVVDETLTRVVSMLRQALGDSAKEPKYIETIPSKGYRLIAKVARNEHLAVDTNEPAEAALSDNEPAAASPALARKRNSATWAVLALLVMGAAVIVLAIGSRTTQPDLVTETVPKDRPTIAVLPFANLSGDADNQAFADGLTEELIHGLAGVAGLRVVSRTSSMRFRDSQLGLGAIAEQLGAQYLLEGAVLAVDDLVRISAQLVRSDTDEHLFSRTYDRRIENVLHLHRAIATDVVRETRTQLTLQESARLDMKEAVDPESYRLYLLGVQATQRRTPEDLRVAIRALEEAVERSPKFALAWSALADARFLSFGYIEDRTGYDRAEETALTALEIDPNLARPYATLGVIYTGRDQDWVRAEEAFLRAIALEPSYATARQWYSEHLSLSGRYDEAVAEVKIALELDPLSPLVRAAAGQRLSAAKRYEEAVAELETAVALGARFLWLYRDLGHALTRLGDEAGAIAARRRDLVLQGASDDDLAELDAAVEESGLEGFWTWVLEHLLERGDENVFALAEAAAGAGDIDAALAWLEQGLEQDVMWFLQMQRTPAFDSLRDDPRYLRLVGEHPLWVP